MMPDIQDVFLPDSSSNAAAELRRSVSARAVQNAVRDYLAANWCGSSPVACDELPVDGDGVAVTFRSAEPVRTDEAADLLSFAFRVAGRSAARVNFRDCFTRLAAGCPEWGGKVTTQAGSEVWLHSLAAGSVSFEGREHQGVVKEFGSFTLTAEVAMSGSTFTPGECPEEEGAENAEKRLAYRAVDSGVVETALAAWFGGCTAGTLPEFGESVAVRVVSAEPFETAEHRDYTAKLEGRSVRGAAFLREMEERYNRLPVSGVTVALPGGSQVVFSALTADDNLEFGLETLLGCEFQTASFRFKVQIDPAESSFVPADYPEVIPPDRSAGRLNGVRLERALAGMIASQLRLKVDREVVRGGFGAPLPDASEPAVAAELTGLEAVNCPSGWKLTFTATLRDSDRTRLLDRLFLLESLLPRYEFMLDGFEVAALCKKSAALKSVSDRGRTLHQAQFPMELTIV